MKLQLFMVLVVCACHFEHTSALSCKTATKENCNATMHVSKMCTNNKCECKYEHYTASKYGCQKLVRPEVTATSSDIPTRGEFIAGGKIKLTCNIAGEGLVTYKWFKDGTEVAGETTKDLVIDPLASANAGKYTCTFTANEVESEKSDPFTLTEITDPSDAANFKIEPKLNGLPATAFAGQKLLLSCDGSPADTTPWTFTFNIDGEKEDAKALNTYEYEFVTGKSFQFSCFAKKGAVELQSIEHDHPTEIFAMPNVDITHSSMQVTGRPATLTCAIRDGVSEEGVTWSWTKDGDAIASATDKEYTIASVSAAHDEKYRCKATFNLLSNDKDKESAEFIVDAVTVSHTLTTNPKKALLNGYIAMTCHVTGAGERYITYIWKKDEKVLYGVNDNIIQLNDISNKDEGDYTCNPIVGGVDMGDSTPKFSVDFNTGAPAVVASLLGTVMVALMILVI